MGEKRMARAPHEDNIAFGECNEMVTIKVDDVNITVHKKVICRSSNYFAGVFENGTIYHEKSRLFQLDELNVYLNWLYTDTVRTGGYTGHDLFYSTEFERLAELFVLGARIEDRAFRNAIITALFEAAQDPNVGDYKLPNANAICVAYQEHDFITEYETGPLRELFVEIYARQPDSGEVDSVFDSPPVFNVPGHFVRDLFRKMVRARSEQPKILKDIDVCSFHKFASSQKECDHMMVASERRRQD